MWEKCSLIGIVVGSVLLGIVQRESYIYNYSQPQRALFIVLSIFHLFHSAYAVATTLLLKVLEVRQSGEFY